MAHNSLTGTVIAPSYFGPGLSPGTNILSGNLSTSDGQSIINIPRVQNATDNGIVTNVGGNANALNCETNLTFDGSLMAIVGGLSASAPVSGSYFSGNGSQLTGITSVSPSGPNYSVQFKNASGNLTGSFGLRFESDRLALAGGLQLSRATTNATLTASTKSYYIGVDSTNNIVDVRLPSASLLLDGQTYVVKDEGGNANSNNITILASGAETIDGANSIVLESPYASVQLYCNGSNKYFIY
jgi:hypothetical protein